MQLEEFADSYPIMLSAVTSPIIGPFREFKIRFWSGSGLLPTDNKFARRLLLQRAVSFGPDTTLRSFA
jgi:hypothetical protein